VRAAALADVLKVILYVIASFVLAAAISPYLYEIGKGFANVALSKNTADKVTWLADKADKADFATYFKRSLFLSALVCLVPFFYSLDLRRDARKRRGHLGSVGFPPHRIPSRMGQPLKKLRWGIFHSFAGFCLATGFFLFMAWFLFALNWFEWNRQPSSGQLWRSFGQAIKPAIGVSIVEELFFRGALLGIFLRAFRPSIAIVSLSLIFAAIHFLTPPDHFSISDPRSTGAGFEMLTLIGQRFLQPQAILHSFVSLFLVGVILGVARFGTASLWLPIGLHTGWVFSMKSFGQLTQRREDLPEKLNLYMGEIMNEGLVPIAILMMTGITVALYLKLLHQRPKEDLPE
jgi:membrane protease YdiL (CAAX protease family)